jgi:hypothetical protein
MQKKKDTIERCQSDENNQRRAPRALESEQNKSKKAVTTFHSHSVLSNRLTKYASVISSLRLSSTVEGRERSRPPSSRVSGI